MKTLAAVLLITIAPIFMKAQNIETNTPVSLLHITKQVCIELTPAYSAIGQTCRQGIAIAISVPSKGDIAGFLVVVHYSGGPDSKGTVSKTQTLFASLDVAPWASTGWWYIDDITVTSVDITPMTAAPGAYSRTLNDHD